jgi:hypothetical protein
MDTDALLQPIYMTKNQVIALMDVVKANTAALKEIKLDLTKCDHQDKVTAILSKVDKAIVDLAMDSQKIPPWVKVTPMDVPLGSSESEFYGQYTVDRPLNPDNPVPWPPGYTPPAQMAMQQAEPPPPPPPAPLSPPPVHHEKEKASETKHKK